MANMQLLAAQAKLANAEKVGNDPDLVKRLKSRVSKLEKAEKSAEPVEEAPEEEPTPEPAKKSPAKKETE